MPYIYKKIKLLNPEKAWKFLVREFKYSTKEAQRAIDRKQLFCNDILVEIKSSLIFGDITVTMYEPNPRGLRPIYENEFFAVFDKPSGVLSHPRNRNTQYSLNDEIKYLYGKEANIVHRLDKETSGLVLVSKSKKYENSLKTLFENKEVFKTYEALVGGKIEKPFMVDAPILVNSDFGLVKLKVYIHEEGKKSITKIKPLEYFEDIDATLIEATPETGRQHQIRVHMFHMKHRIIGDPIYGVSPLFSARYLDGEILEEDRLKICKAPRLLLHAKKIQFSFKDEHYEFISDFDTKTTFYNFAKSAI